MTMQKIFDMSPTIQRLKVEAASEKARGVILRRLVKRFGSVPENLTPHLQTIHNSERLDYLIDVAHDCPDLDAFRASLTATT
jgi:hypothetical protein